MPISKIAGLSSGEFVGMVADDPDQKIKLKTFHAAITNQPKKRVKSMEGTNEIPLIQTLQPVDISETIFASKKRLKI